MTRIRLSSGTALLLAVVLLGCAKNKQAPGTVSGSVSYKGQPVKAGTVAFHTKEGTAYSGQISSDGTYSIVDLPEGELVVTVETESISPNKKASQGKDAEKRTKMMQQPPPSGVAAAPDLSSLYTKIPNKYASSKTSPITATIKSGRQVHNIELTD